jgi:rubrerythrin
MPCHSDENERLSKQLSNPMRQFDQLDPREVLALAMDIERNNAARLATLANLYKGERIGIANFFADLRKEELEHLKTLQDFWEEQFGGEQPPEISEMDVTEVIEAVEIEHGEHLIFDDLEMVKAIHAVRQAEHQAEEFYRTASAAANDNAFKSLYSKLADLESSHRAALDTLERESGRQT